MQNYQLPATLTSSSMNPTQKCLPAPNSTAPQSSLSVVAQIVAYDDVFQRHEVRFPNGTQCYVDLKTRSCLQDVINELYLDDIEGFYASLVGRVILVERLIPYEMIASGVTLIK